MGLVDRIKNIFTEEVEDDEEEIKVEQIKKDVRSVPIESPSVEKTPTREETKKEEEFLLEEEEKKTNEEKKNSAVFFTDRDFEDLVTPRRSRERDVVKQPEKIVEEKKEETPKPYGGAYSSTSILHTEKQNFKPTPIISPVYGILDKNYHKEDIIDHKESVTRAKNSADGLSVDSIRNKAFGTLEDDLQESMTAKPVTFEEPKEEVDLFDELEGKDKVEPKVVPQKANVRELEEATVDLTKELDNLLLKKEKDKKMTSSTSASKAKPKKKDASISESDLFNLIDSMYEEGDE